MRMRALSRAAAAAAVLLWAVVPVNPTAATVLTFNPTLTGAAANQLYGDRVTGPGEMTPDGPRYGAEYGWTPNVTVFYEQNLRQWDTGYGDLVNVLYEESGHSNWQMRIILYADPGYLVSLHQFDLGVLAGPSYSPDRVAVTDGVGTPLWESFRPLLASTVPPSRTEFRFEPPIVSETLQIFIEFPSLPIKLRRIAIDNIGFGQMIVPSPGSGVLVLFGGGLALLTRRRAA
jgi:hypothetical protein